MNTLKQSLLIPFLISLTCGASQLEHLLNAPQVITHFGAIGDGKTLNTQAIQTVIDQCHQKGGGQVVIPSGTFLSGTLILKDHVNLHLKKGAVLLGSTRHDDYPSFHPKYRSHKDINGFNALIYAEGASDISITGSGTIDGQGKKQCPRKGKQFKTDRDGRPRNILFISCKNILIRGITLKNSGVWNQHYLDCEDLLVDGVTVWNHANRNNDGIDIDGCRRVRLIDSSFDSDDDGICLKATGLAGCEDVVISNCVASSHCNAIKIGTESTGDFKNILFTDCVIKPSASDHAVFGRKEGISGVTIACVDGGNCENISVRNLQIEGTKVPLFVRLGKRNRPHTQGAKVLKDSTMKNITFSQIKGKNGGDWGCAFLGLLGNPIENLSFDNIHLEFAGGGTQTDAERKIPERLAAYPQPTSWGKLPAYGFFIRNVTDVKTNNVTLKTKTPDQRPPIKTLDS